MRAHHNIAKRLWQGIRAAAKGWIITTERTVVGLQGLQQPAERIDDWQRAWDEMTDVHLEGEDMRTHIDAANPAKAARRLGGKLGQKVSLHPEVHEANRQVCARSGSSKH